MGVSVLAGRVTFLEASQATLNRYIGKCLENKSIAVIATNF